MRVIRLAAMAAVVLAAVACTAEPDPSGAERALQYNSDEKTLTIVAGSEQQAVLKSVVEPWCAGKGYRCTVTLKGSVDQARLLAGGNAPYDAFWFASSVFQQVGDQSSKLQDVKPMFLTPVVFAGWRSEMQRLGFAGRSDVTISEILAAVESGKTRVWVANPTQSNSGATVLLGFMNHFAGNGPGKALTQAQLDSALVDTGITRFIRAMDQTLPSTGTLMTECVAHADRCKTLFTYEDLVIEQNLALVKAGKEPLTVAYPRGSLAVSDAPLGFLPHGTGADAKKREIFTALQTHLLTSPDAQAALLKLGRRPATSVGLTLDNPDPAIFNPAWGVQATLNEQGIQYPSTAVIEAALKRYQTHYRKPVDIYYCLDGSGSMNDNGGWRGVQQAAHQVFDPDKAAVNMLQTHPEDRTTVTIFNSKVTGGSPWTVAGDDAAQLRGLAEKIDNHSPDGGTNMYSCLDQAAKSFNGRKDDRKWLVVVMTDGHSEGQGDGERAVRSLAELKVPVIGIAFGDGADPAQLKAVATATGGAFYQQESLVAALRLAAGYK